MVNSLIDQLGDPRQRATASRRLVALRQPEQVGKARRYPHAPATPLGQPALLGALEGGTESGSYAELAATVVCAGMLAG